MRLLRENKSSVTTLPAKQSNSFGLSSVIRIGSNSSLDFNNQDDNNAYITSITESKRHSNPPQQWTIARAQKLIHLEERERQQQSAHKLHSQIQQEQQEQILRKRKQHKILQDQQKQQQLYKLKLKKNISFKSTVYITWTYDRVSYNRSGTEPACMGKEDRLELDAFKIQEMPIHEESTKRTKLESEHSYKIEAVRKKKLFLQRQYSIQRSHQYSYCKKVLLGEIKNDDLLYDLNEVNDTLKKQQSDRNNLKTFLQRKLSPKSTETRSENQKNIVILNYLDSEDCDCDVFPDFNDKEDILLGPEMYTCFVEFKDKYKSLSYKEFLNSTKCLT
eukprot:Pgem_evm1s10419